MNEPPPISIPRILIVEDDPVSAAYMGEVAASLPAQIDVAGSVAQALAIASIGQHALLLIDAHLPDGSGKTLLKALRGNGVTAPAMAHTAATEPALHEQLLAAGFVEVLRKPLAMVAFEAALLRHLPQPDSTSATVADLPRWDDAAALAALGGQRANVDALRGLFIEELPGQRHRITLACREGDTASVGDELHRLVASCGFVGATRLGSAVRRMQDSPLDPDALDVLQSAIEEVLASTWAMRG